MSPKDSFLGVSPKDSFLGVCRLKIVFLACVAFRFVLVAFVAFRGHLQASFYGVVSPLVSFHSVCHFQASFLFSPASVKLGFIGGFHCHVIKK